MKKESVKKIFLILTIVLLVVGSVFLVNAINKKNNYYNSDYSSRSVNAYVGGDAYNYIINAGYFTGYAVLAGSCYILSGMFFCSYAKLNIAVPKSEISKDVSGEQSQGIIAPTELSPLTVPNVTVCDGGTIVEKSNEE